MRPGAVEGEAGARANADVHSLTHSLTIGRVRRRQTKTSSTQSRRSGLVQAAGANYEDPA